MRRRLGVACGLSAIAAVLVAVPALSATGTARELRFTAAGRADAKLVLVRRGGEIVVRRAGGGRTLARRALAATRLVSIRGVDGRVDNTLTVDLSGGPIAVAGGVRYDGGHGGINTLVLRGGHAGPGRDIASGPHSGVLIAGRTRIRYADIAPVIDTTPSANDTVAPGTAGPVTISTDPAASPQTVTIASAASTPLFERITIANKTNLAIDLPAGTSSVTVDMPTASTGLTSLTIDATAGTGNSASIAALDVAVPLTYRGASGDAVTVGTGAGTSAVAGPLTLSFAAGGSVTLNDAGDTTGRSVAVGATTVSGLTPTAVTYSNAGQLAVVGGSGSDTFDVTPSASTAYSIAGGGPAPPAFPGDELTAALAGTTGATLVGTPGVAGARGAWLFTNRAPVQFENIDSLDPTSASIADGTVNPGPSGVTPLTFTASLLAPDPNPVQLSYATADGSATAAAGNYTAASGNLLFAAGQTTQQLTVGVPGTTTPGPTRTFLVNIGAVGNVQLSRTQATGTILDTATTPPPPTLTGLTQSAERWRAGKAHATISAKRRAPVGTAFTFTLSEAASVTLRFTRSTGGRRVAGSCVAQTRANRHRVKCTRSVAAGTLSGLAGHAGGDRIAFDGVVDGGRTLPPGSYEVTVTATDSTSRSTSPATLAFTVVK